VFNPTARDKPEVDPVYQALLKRKGKIEGFGFLFHSLLGYLMSF
jgi:hypothetical protein